MPPTLVTSERRWLTSLPGAMAPVATVSLRGAPATARLNRREGAGGPSYSLNLDDVVGGRSATDPVCGGGTAIYTRLSDRDRAGPSAHSSAPTSSSSSEDGSRSSRGSADG